MVGSHGDEPQAVADACEFSHGETVVDVGGGTGNLLAAFLGRHPSVRGVLADVPHVVNKARTRIASFGVLERCDLRPSTFSSAFQLGDVYLLSHVIHDWTEEQCLAILRNARRARNAGSRLRIVEMVLPAGDTPHPGKLLDLAMLVMPGGQERTAEEYRPLLNAARLRMTRVIPTASAVSVVEAVTVD